MDPVELKQNRSISLLPWNIYRIASLGFLRRIGILDRREIKNKIEKIVEVPRYRLFSYHVRNIEPNLAQSRTPSGIIIQPSDSVLGNYDIYRSNIFEIFYEIKSNDVVVDVGAHVGIFALKAARKAKNGVVVAVEPYIPNYKLLMLNISYNKIKNILAVNIALSDFKGTTKLYIDHGSLGHTIDEKRLKIVNFPKERYAETKVLTLDNLIHQLELSKVDFVKINIEGSELSVLKGAEKTLEENDLVLAIATDHYPNQTEEVITYLKRKGYIAFPYNYNRFVYAKARDLCRGR